MEYDSGKGILLCATGNQKYYSMCNTLVQDIRETMPDIPIAVYTDNKEKILDADVFIDGRHVQEKVFISKINACQASPFIKTLFIDVDSRLLRPVYHIFEVLDTHHFAFGFTDGRPAFWGGDQDGQYNQFIFSSSTLLFTKNEDVNGIFRRWHKEYAKQTLVPANGDQMYLSFLIFNEPKIRYTVLPVEYRFNCDHPQVAKGKIRIITSLVTDYREYREISRGALDDFFNKNQSKRVIYFNLLGKYKWKTKKRKIQNRITIYTKVKHKDIIRILYDILLKLAYYLKKF